MAERFRAEWFRVDSRHLRDLNLVGATDPEIFQAASLAEAVLITKDSDFVDLVRRKGHPPQVVWITCGNTER